MNDYTTSHCRTVVENKHLFKAWFVHNKDTIDKWVSEVLGMHTVRARLCVVLPWNQCMWWLHVKYAGTGMDILLQVRQQLEGSVYKSSGVQVLEGENCIQRKKRMWSAHWLNAMWRFYSEYSKFYCRLMALDCFWTWFRFFFLSVMLHCGSEIEP